MSYHPTYQRGQWLVICDSCGRQYKATQLRKRWDGLMVCDDDWEPRQPQDFVRGVADFQAPPYTRPEASDTFIVFCTVEGSTAIADYAVADCVVCDYINPAFNP